MGDSVEIRRLDSKNYARSLSLLPMLIKTSFPHYIDPIEVYTWMVDQCEDESLGFFVGFLNKEPRGFTILALPCENPFGRIGHGLWLHAESPLVRRALVWESINFLRDHNVEDLRMTNFTDACDEAWLRMFRRHGSLRRVGTTFMLEL